MQFLKLSLNLDILFLKRSHFFMYIMTDMTAFELSAGGWWWGFSHGVGGKGIVEHFSLGTIFEINSHLKVQPELEIGTNLN